MSVDLLLEDKKRHNEVTATGICTRSRTTQQKCSHEDMLPDPQIIECRRLWREEGLMIKEIAKRVGKSRDVVRVLIDGYRPASTDKSTFQVSYNETFHYNPVKCPTCFGKINITPCRLCATRKRKAVHDACAQ